MQTAATWATVSIRNTANAVVQILQSRADHQMKGKITAEQMVPKLGAATAGDRPQKAAALGERHRHKP